MPPSTMSLQQVRVVDPILTTITQGYGQGELIGSMILPLVEVTLYGGKIVQFDKTAFHTYNSKRVPGQNIKRIQTGYEGLPFSLELDALEHPIPLEYLNDANMIGIDWESHAIGEVMSGLTLNLETEQATLLTTNANYATTNRITLSGTSQWNDPTSNPGPVIRDGKESVRAITGSYPNVWWMGAEVFAAISENPLVTDRFKHTSKDSITTDMIAALYGFDRVLVGGAVKTDPNGNSDTLTDVWGKQSGLAYVNPLALRSGRINYRMGGAINRFQPSLGYTYVMRGHPFAKPRYYEANSNSYVYGAHFDRDPVLTGVDSAGKIVAGFLFNNAIA